MFFSEITETQRKCTVDHPSFFFFFNVKYGNTFNIYNIVLILFEILTFFLYIIYIFENVLLIHSSCVQ